MFTGIIEELGSVREIELRGEDARMVIEARAVTEGSRDGDSISVNGVCLTALNVNPDSFAADVSKETLFRSTLENLKPGSAVNLERAVTPATRLGGHIVQGHVDARGKLLLSVNHGDSWTFRFGYPKEMARYLVLKGSVAVEGISLTIANLTDEYFEIAVIPKTLELTNFSHLQPDDEVNLEADVLAKHLEKLLRDSQRESEKPNSAVQRVNLGRSILALVVILILVAANYYAFRWLSLSYFQWYLKYGPIISLAAGFLAPTWIGMTARLGLISASPILYMASWLQIVGVFIHSLAPMKSTTREEAPGVPVNIGLNGNLVLVFDELMYRILVLVMTLLMLAWLVIVAPLAFFVTLIAGVPARQSLRGRISKTYIKEAGGQVEPVDVPQTGRSPGSDLSFARDPFAITQATTALVLWIAGLIYARF